MTIAPAALAALAIVGTVASVAGIAVQTSAAVNAANYQAQVAERNKAIQLDNANRAIARSQQEQEDQDRKNAFLYGQQTAVQAASGLKLGGRSFLLTRKSARELGRLDSLNVRQAGELEAYNYKVLSEDSAAAAGFARSQANSSLLEGFLSAGSSIIGGAGKVSTLGFGAPKIGSSFRGGWGSSAFA